MALCACAVGAVGVGAPSAIAAINTSIRVEGSAATLIPERPIALNDSGGDGSITDSFDNEVFVVPLASASAQLTLGAAELNLPVGYDVPPAGSIVKQIATDANVLLGAQWRMKVNNVRPVDGPDDVILKEGDRVTWAYVANINLLELDVQVPASPVQNGNLFPVTVVGYDNAGTPIPVSGVTVTFREAVALTGPDGTAQLLANGSGPAGVTAVKVGTVRAAADQLCSYPAENPPACGLPPLPGQQPTTPTTPTTPTNTNTTTRPTTPAVINPLCAVVPKRPPVTRSNPKNVKLTVGQLITNQRISQAAVRRANGILLWLEAGLMERDFCGGSIGPRDVAPGIGIDLTGPRDAPTRARPRPVEIQPPVRVDATQVAFTPAQLQINQRISQAAVRRANALAVRIEKGLTGGDIRDGALTVRKTVPGMRVQLTDRTGARVPERSPTEDAEPGAPSRVPVQATRLQLVINQRIAQTAVRRVNELLDKIAAGFSGEDIANGTLTIQDFAPGVRLASDIPIPASD